MAFDFENGSKPVTNINRAGIFAWPFNDLWAVNGQGFQPFL